MTQFNLCELLNIKYPIIQGGMIWCSGWELASAVSINGGLGVIGAGSMYPEVLREHIEKVQLATKNPFGVNLPLLYPNIEEHITTCIEMKVPIVITSAGNPNIWTSKLQASGIKVMHVVSSSLFAIKAAKSGVDAVIAEGFEAGGHNGRDETTTMCLIPKVRELIEIPLIAAGGISSGRTMLAAMALGADGVQIGSRFVATIESSAHINFKEKIIAANEGDTKLMLKDLTPVRLLKNAFYLQVLQAETNGMSKENLIQLLGKGRAKKGMFEGNMIEGELEIGQVSANFDQIVPVATVINEIWDSFLYHKNRLINL